MDNSSSNPYVGPRTFTRAQKDLHFGREREGRELLSLVVSQRLVLFYAQSGAGKSSLINTQLIPGLETRGFVVLPVGRVGGELLGGVDDTVDNIYLFNLMSSLDQSQRDPARLAHLTLPHFLEQLTTEDGEEWYYEGETEGEADKERGREGGGESEPIGSEETRNVTADAQLAIRNPSTMLRTSSPLTPNYVLIIDQFEEIITTHGERWRDRAAFFRQLEAAMVADPTLWVVLTLREDFVASLDPYAPLLSDKLRARYYMQRMGVEAARQAISRPAEARQRRFQPAAIDLLLNNLSQVRVAGKASTESGQYIEPVQLQVVCYQLWEGLKNRFAPLISTEDVQKAGDVDRALASFYEETLTAALQAVPLAGGERRLRRWFEEKLLTEAGTRGTVYQGEHETAGLPNELVLELANRFLLRSEARSGGRWVELTHDRFVKPIVAANHAWETKQNNPLAAVTRLWLENGRDAARLLRGQQLLDAQTFATAQGELLSQEERDFLTTSVQQAAQQAEAARQARRRRLTLIGSGIAALILFALLAAWGWRSANEAQRQTKLAEANTMLAEQQLKLLEGEKLLQDARDLKAKGDLQGAEVKFEAASRYPNLKLDLVAEKADLRRQIATKLVQEGEALAKNSDFAGRDSKFKAAFDLQPPSDTLLYVWIAPGEFTMGSSANDSLAQDDEKPQHSVKLSGYWIMRTEVTNIQYARCVAAHVCTPPNNQRWNNPQFSLHPVTDVDWQQANDYAVWVGGRLPTEAEWEKACRGTDKRIYPWGDQEPSAEKLNYYDSGLATWTNVGSYPAGANGLFDMAGNVWEWTEDWYNSEYYLKSPFDNPKGPSKGDYRTLRGGSFDLYENVVRCADRFDISPYYRNYNVGFRVVSPGF